MPTSSARCAGVFKADGPETDDRYCVSEWSVEPGKAGPGPHHHEANEELFLVTEGTLSFLVGEQWIDAPRGTFLRVPAGVTHDFANRTAEPATAFNVFVPGGFEAPFREWGRAQLNDVVALAQGLYHPLEPMYHL